MDITTANRLYELRKQHGYSQDELADKLNVSRQAISKWERSVSLKLIDLIRIYFQDTAAKGITARNQLIEMATASLSDLMKEHPEHRAEAKQDLQLLNAQKIGEHEAEIEKIKNVFLAILRDIKKDIDNGEQPGEAVTAAMFQAMRDALAEQKQKPLSIDDVTAMIAGQIGQLTPMDKETVEMFQQFAKKMIEQAGTK